MSTCVGFYERARGKNAGCGDRLIGCAIRPFARLVHCNVTIENWTIDASLARGLQIYPAADYLIWAKQAGTRPHLLVLDRNVNESIMSVLLPHQGRPVEAMRVFLEVCGLRFQRPAWSCVALTMQLLGLSDEHRAGMTPDACYRICERFDLLGAMHHDPGDPQEAEEAA